MCVCVRVCISLYAIIDLYRGYVLSVHWNYFFIFKGKLQIWKNNNSKRVLASAASASSSFLVTLKNPNYLYVCTHYLVRRFLKWILLLFYHFQI